MKKYLNLNIDQKTSLKLVFVMLFWGTTFVSGRVLSQNYHPYVVAFLRFLIACFFLLPLLYWNKKESFLPTKKQILPLFFLGLTGIFSYNWFYFSGLKLIEAGKASIIIASNPVVTAILAGIFFKEKLTLKKILGFTLALLGVLLVITDGKIVEFFNKPITSTDSTGEFYLLGAVISWVTYTLLGKKILSSISPLKSIAWSCFMGTALLLPFACYFGLSGDIQKLSFHDVAHLFSLGFFATVLGFIWFYEGIKEFGAAKAAVFINLVPLFATTSGVLVLNENLNSALILGGICVLSGITIVRLKS